MPLRLYHFPPSAPSRSTLMTLRMLKLDVDVFIINLFSKEQLSDWFIKINPQHTVPTLVDGDFVLWESRAINAYLVSTYGPDTTLYPQNPKAKAIVDQQLQFDLGVLYKRIRDICFPVLFMNETTIPYGKKKNLDEAMKWVDSFLEKDKWIAGEHLTIADITFLASISSIVAVGYELNNFPNIQKWLKQCEENITGFDENKVGSDIFGKQVKMKLMNTNF